MFERTEVDNIGIWQDDLLKKHQELLHAFSERGKDGNFNLALHTNDNREKVLNNRQKWASALHINMEQMVTMEQVHGVNVEIVAKKDCGRGAQDYADAMKATDGLITNERGVALFACFADCVPLFFYDPKKRVIALSHGGWKGTVGGIAPLTAKKMTETFGSDYADILVAIGPSIGACHYEVDGRVISAVKKYACADRVLTPTDQAHARLDLPLLNKLLLMELGIKEENISLSGICTYCRKDSFFSYRAENGKCGRMAATIMLKED